MVSGLYASYGPIQVLRDINFAVGEGKMLCVLGANGAGKTTLLRALSGMIPFQGSVTFRGQPIKGVPTHRLARMGIVHVPELRGTFAELSVEENLRLGALCSTANQREKLEDRDRVFSYFPRLQERSRQQAGSLSGGEQQMLAIGRALVSRPKLMLMDEPSFGLAPQIVTEIYKILTVLKDDHQLGVILVEQHAALALELADDAVVIASGQIVVSGPSREIKADSRIQESYFGAENY
jgi:branched-chain amino acid transport system ATP-binding protein